MHKSRSLPRTFRWRPAVSLLVVAIIVGPLLPAQAAEDAALMTFQNEVVAAKQKQQSISTTVQQLQSPDTSTSEGSQLSDAAERLIRELTAKDVVHENQPDTVKLEPSQPARASGGYPRGALRRLEQLGQEPPDKRKFKLPFLYYREPRKKSLAGEEVYRTAMQDNKITVQEAIDIGLANNLQAVAAEKRIDAAKAKLDEAKRARWPTVAFVLEENGGKVSNRLYKGRNRKLNITQPVYYGGELVLTVKQAELAVKTAEKELEKAKFELIQTIRTSYYGVLKAEYNLQYQNELFNEVQQIWKRTEAEKRQKVIAEIDYLNIRSTFQQVEFQKDSAKNDLLSSALLLNQTINVPPDQPVPIDLRLGFRKIRPTLDEVLDQAMLYNSDIQIRLIAIESARYGLKVYEAKKRPRIDARGSFGYLGEVFKDDEQIATDNHDLDTEREWFLGFVGNMPLGASSVEYAPIKHRYGPTVLALTGSEDWSHKVTFNLWDRLADISDQKGAEAALLQAEAELEKSKGDLIANVREEFYNLEKSLIQIDSSVVRIRYQDKQNEIHRYMAGLQETSLATLVDGLIEQASNRFAFIQAVTEYHLATSNLNLMMGHPDYFKSEA
ncbi:MAG: hypothetical protein MOGMAGMI_02287 [Candidatus Omnitrophica bacterium]|nr:hypothetical protein [Candidatus Omnitrophota bacterium]